MRCDDRNVDVEHSECLEVASLSTVSAYEGGDRNTCLGVSVEDKTHKVFLPIISIKQHARTADSGPEGPKPGQKLKGQTNILPWKRAFERATRAAAEYQIEMEEYKENRWKVLQARRLIQDWVCDYIILELEEVPDDAEDPNAAHKYIQDIDKDNEVYVRKEILSKVDAMKLGDFENVAATSSQHRRYKADLKEAGYILHVVMMKWQPTSLSDLPRRIDPPLTTMTSADSTVFKALTISSSWTEHSWLW
ncbi:uncharacterized protein A1O5_10961 [Cladophialophora psammophila CBS 110553]|uniref:Uncharacterized protein n=1 Tax=Cladophialophora psammophila CBS 110553 TaxID=1182543 RepID=W9X6A1_9EURO|nr:uncharacterized protein A1O5_10961 [Cladophialophora psammophila CBS 110553]EXJ65984.1 hypothetical protein A1O5_10961 [Cladophialophora psammophila CBS 110553]